MRNLIGQTFKTVLYSSVIGKIVLENTIEHVDTISTNLVVVFPDGVATDVASLTEACDLLEKSG